MLELQVAIFVVLAMVLRRKPDVLISLLLIMRENPKYQGQDKLPVTAWIIAQVTVENIEDMISCPCFKHLNLKLGTLFIYLFCLDCPRRFGGGAIHVGASSFAHAEWEVKL